MNESYIPAIVTAVAGIFGIIINISVNTWYRHSDARQRRFDKEIEAYEQFYQPLQQYLRTFEIHLNSLKIQCDQNSFFLQLSAHNTGQKKLPGHLMTLESDYADALSSLINFTQTSRFQVIRNYKIKFYYDLVLSTINILHQSKQCKIEFSPNEIDINSIRHLNDKISDLSVELYAINLLHKIYLIMWRKYQQQQQHNNN